MSGEPLEPRIYSGRPPRLWPPPDWRAEAEEERQRRRQQAETST